MSDKAQSFCDMFPSFPNYTEEMYKGNIPTRKSDYRENWFEWETEHGTAITNDKEELIWCNFTIKYPKVVGICGDCLKIMHISSESGKSRYFSNKGNYPLLRHIVIDDEEAKNILNKKLPDCKIWLLIQKRARKLFEDYIKEKYAFLKKEREKE